MTYVTLDTVRNDLTYLLGNESQITPWPVSYDNFIQRALERISRRVDFDFGKTVGTVTFTNGVGALPTNARQSPELDVRVINSGQLDDYVFSPIPYEKQDLYTQGDYKYWVTTDTQGIQYLNTKDTNIPTVTVRYSLAAPTINSSIGTNFPSSMAIAKGALIYVREGEDKDADTAPEEAKFTNELEEIIAAMDRNQPLGPAPYIADISGHYTGDIHTSDYPFETIRSS